MDAGDAVGVELHTHPLRRPRRKPHSSFSNDEYVRSLTYEQQNVSCVFYSFVLHMASNSI